MGAYVRVSSAGQTAASQRAAISRACAARGEAIDVWFQDKATGATLKRPALTELREAVRSGRLRKVWVYRFDRLSRTGIRDTLTLLEELRGAGCKVVSVADGLPDEDGPFGEIVLAFHAWVAKHERSLIQDRQAAARKRLEAEGRSWGRPKRLTPEREAWFVEQLKSHTYDELVEQTGVSKSTLIRLKRRAKLASRARAGRA